MCEMSLLGYHNKTPQPGWLDNRNLFSYLLEAGSPRSILEASGLKFGFSLGLYLQMATFLLCLHMVFFPCVGMLIISFLFKFHLISTLAD